MLHILIADDHPIVRAAYINLLKDRIGSVAMMEAGSGAEALAMLERHPFELVVLDLTLPDGLGMSRIEEMLRAAPATKILVVSALPEEMYALEALRRGAMGFLAKARAAEEMPLALQRVLAGQRYVSAAITARLKQLPAYTKAMHELLSRRELEVFGRLANGTTLTEVAAQLGLSVKTIGTYRTRILGKMGFTTNAELTAYAMRHRLVPSD